MTRKGTFTSLGGMMLCCVLGLVARGADGPRAETFWDIQQWTSEQGLPENTITALAQTPDGFLWIGTFQGLARFDGVEFTTYTAANTPGLASDAINGLGVDSAGTLWIATKEGLCSWRNGLAEVWNKKRGMPDRSSYQIVPCPDGGIWFRSGDHCGHIQDGIIHNYGAEDGLANPKIWSIAPGRDGSLVVSSHAGFQHLRARSKSEFDQLTPWPAGGSEWTICEDSTGRLWAGANTGAFRYEKGQWTVLSEVNEPRNERSCKCYESRSGDLWWTSHVSSLHCLLAGQMVALPIGQKPEQSGIKAMFEDREGNMWIGTDREGLYRLRPRRIRSWTMHDGLPHNKTKSVCAGPDGSVWVGTELGLAKIQNHQATNFQAFEPGQEYPIAAVCADVSGATWVGKPDFGLLRLDGDHFKTVRILDDERAFVSSLYELEAGRICVGINRGISVYQDGHWERLVERGANGDTVYAMRKDRSGMLWLGTQGNGVKRLSEGHLSNLTTTDGLSDDRVTSLYEDRDGAIWIGTLHGLNRFKNGNLTSFGLKEGLAEMVINQILEDDFGNLWLSGHQGVHRIALRELNAVADKLAGKAQCFSYGESDGMASAETQGKIQPAGCKTSDGHLWFPTVKGVVEVNPATLIQSEVQPKVVIEQIAFGDQIIFGEGMRDGLDKSSSTAFRGAGSIANGTNQLLKLPAGGGQFLLIRYTGTLLSSPEKVRFKYKLEPRDKQWVEAGAQRFVHLHGLAPGNYTFRVMARNRHGLWSEQGASLAFYLPPAFHQTIWFSILLGLVGLLILGGIIIWRLRWQRQVLSAQHAASLAEERTRIARDLHDELGSRLTALAMRTELAGRQANGHAPKNWSSLADESRALAERMRDVIWTVDPECDLLEALAARVAAHAEEFLGTAGIRLRLEFPEALPNLSISADARHHLSMVCKEALHNVVKHSRATQVRLGLDARDGQLRLLINDNGLGFQLERDRGHGLANMQARIDALSGTLEIHSEPGGGVSIRVNVPLSTLNRTRSEL